MRVNIINNLEEYTTKINALRLKGGVYNALELAKALKGIPYNGSLPTIMRRNPKISGYKVLDGGILFDKSKAIYKEAVLFLITEAKAYQKECTKKYHEKYDIFKVLKKYGYDKPESPLELEKVIQALCLQLYFNGESYKVVNIQKVYSNYKQKKFFRPIYKIC